MKASVLAALLVSTMSLSAFANPSIRCTSDYMESASELKFDHSFELQSRQGFSGLYTKSYFELVPGLTVLVEANQYDESNDTSIQIVVARTESGRGFAAWSPYASGKSKNSLLLSLNANSISGRIDYSEIPEKKFTESAQKYKDRVIESLQKQESSSLKQSFQEKFGELAYIFCRKVQ